MNRQTESDFVQQIFQFGGDARIMTFFHSGHYFEKWEDPQLYYLNYEYFFWIKYAHRIDTMVVSTQEQKEELIGKLKEYYCTVPKVEVIPVAGLSQLRYPQGRRKPYSLVSASRINPKKKIEWIVRSVVKAHEKNPNIFIDIYGGQEALYIRHVQEMVAANDAQSYIHVKGYVDVTELYKEYEVYVSASLGETFGLTLMEAVGSGLTMIGLDVKYGNRLFIENEKNGYLIPYDRKYIENDDGELIDAMAEKIVEIFQDQNRLERFHQASYEIAKGFSDEIIGEKWRKLFSGVQR